MVHVQHLCYIHGSEQIKNDITQYVKQVACSLTDSIMDLDCTARAAYVSRLYQWALTEQRGVGRASSAINQLCSEARDKLNAAKDLSLDAQEVEFVLRKTQAVLQTEQNKALKANGDHSCGSNCHRCDEKGAKIDQEEFVTVVSVLEKINSIHLTACRIA